MIVFVVKGVIGYIFCVVVIFLLWFEFLGRANGVCFCVGYLGWVVGICGRKSFNINVGIKKRLVLGAFFYLAVGFFM